MLAHSPRDRSRSPLTSNGTTASQMKHSSIKPSPSTIHGSNHDDSSSQIDMTSSAGDTSAKMKKESEFQQRMKSLKSFIRTLIADSSLLSSSTIGSNYDEQMKILENACLDEYRDLSLDRIRRMIRSVLKLRKTHQSSSSSSSHSHTTTPSYLHRDHGNILSNSIDRFNCGETSSNEMTRSNSNNKKNRSNSLANTTTNSTKTTSDLVTSSTTSTLSALDADFLRHAFSQQFRPPPDLSAYFSAAAAAAAASNGTAPPSSLFRPNFSPSNFLQSLTNTTPLAPPPPPPPLVSTHSHTNGTSDTSSTMITKSSKSMKLTSNEASSIKVLINAYREAASYLCRSADELEQLI